MILMLCRDFKPENVMLDDQVQSLMLVFCCSLSTHTTGCDMSCVAAPVHPQVVFEHRIPHSLTQRILKLVDFGQCAQLSRPQVADNICTRDCRAPEVCSLLAGHLL